MVDGYGGWLSEDVITLAAGAPFQGARVMINTANDETNG
jgi:hypothetical protein